MLTARYTEFVGDWRTRAVSALVIAVLAGGAPFTLLCDALCSDRPHETAASEASLHHASATQRPPAHADRAGAHAAAGHDHQLSRALATESFPESNSQLNGSLERQCCSSRGASRLSLTAGRADTSLLSAPQAPVFLAAAVSDPLDRYARGLMHASPPGPIAPVRAALVLRI